MSRLSYKSRTRLKKSSFALPGKRTKRNKAGRGAYPIPDISHARNALARSAGKSVAGAVRAKVYKKFPSLRKRKK